MEIVSTAVLVLQRRNLPCGEEICYVKKNLPSEEESAMWRRRISHLRKRRKETRERRTTIPSCGNEEEIAKKLCFALFERSVFHFGLK